MYTVSYSSYINFCCDIFNKPTEKLSSMAWPHHYKLHYLVHNNKEQTINKILCSLFIHKIVAICRQKSFLQ